MSIRRFFFIAFFLISISGLAQTGVRHKIAVFAPLYLDSAFDQSGEYRFAKNVFPKYINPGLEFYEGIQLALDSMAKEQIPLDVYVYDSRSATKTLAQELAAPEMDSVELILAHGNGTEMKQLADAGLHRNIPVINVNLPNDAMVTGNPFFVVLNSTLKTQVEGIYRYIQRNYALKPLVIFRKKGTMEDRIKSYIDDFSKTTSAVPLKYKYVDLPDSFTVANLKPLLDTVNVTVCIAGSLDDAFGQRLAKQLSSLGLTYPVTLIGMPTWDVFPLNKPEYKDVEIIYSTPFYSARTDKVSQRILTLFNAKMFSRPSDMVYRGFETAWKYGRLLLQYGHDLSSNLGSAQAKLFTDFDVQPVLNKQTMTLDYFENKKLYFVKWKDGVIKSVY